MPHKCSMPSAIPSCASSISATAPMNTGFIWPRFSPTMMAGAISAKEPSSTGRYNAQRSAMAKPPFFSADGHTHNTAARAAVAAVERRPCHQRHGKGDADGGADQRHRLGAVFLAGEVGQHGGDRGGNGARALQCAAGDGPGDIGSRHGNKTAEGEHDKAEDEDRP